MVRTARAGQPIAPDPVMPPNQNPDPQNPTTVPPPPPAETPSEAPAEGDQPAKTTKSIVPSKYSARYKNGGEDPLALFIKKECASQEGFSFDKFFELCKHNGIADDKVDHYRDQVAAKRHGAEGRARMTLRNMLATIVRKNGKAVSLSGDEIPLSLPKAALTGAAKAAQERSSSDEGQASAA